MGGHLHMLDFIKGGLRYSALINRKANTIQCSNPCLFHKLRWYMGEERERGRGKEKRRGRERERGVN
jgi:hypothetical protein